MLFQDASSGKILYRKFVKNETNRDYLDGLRYIAERGTIIKAVVCDEHPDIQIPNTTNQLEGFNSQLKRALHNHNGLIHNHNGLNGTNKKKFIDGFINTKNRLE